MTFQPPPGTPEKGKTLFSLCIACIVLTTLTLVIRMWSRSTLSRNKFGADDWMCLASFPFVVGLLGIAAAMRKNGFGYHIADVPADVFRTGLQLTFASHHLYNIAIALVRFSALLFYRRVFETNSKFFVWNFWGASTANLAQVIGLTFASLFFCLPVESFWDRSLPGSHCRNAFDLQLASGVTAVFIDVWILLIPVWPLWKLQLRLSRRILVFCLFITGYSVVVFTIGRMSSVFITGDAFNTDFTWGFITTIYWYVGELTVAFISISLPTAFYLFKRAATYGIASVFNDRDYLLESGSVYSPRRNREHGSSKIDSLSGSSASAAAGAVQVDYELEQTSTKGSLPIRDHVVPFDEEAQRGVQTRVGV